ncbi:MAG: KAP family NTPase [Pseudomonadota bacterium]|nr:KAP family NTPase [Pseudomonadota bacterium]
MLTLENTSRIKSVEKVNRFIFVVDDLDRCSPDGVVKTLEAIRLVMELKNVVVIVAIDPRIALSSLALHYEKLANHHVADPLAIARDYLSKVINTSLVLEKASGDDIENYLENHLWNKDEVPERAVSDSAELSASSASVTSEKEVASVGADTDIEKHRQMKQEIKSGKTASAIQSIKTESAQQNTSSVTESVTEPVTEREKPERKQEENPESDHKTEQEPVNQILTGLSRSQKNVFKYWVQKLDLYNPRQLKRLNNAYALIRLCYADEDQALQSSEAGTDGQGMAPQYKRLIMMLWLEYLHELPNETRSPFVGALDNRLDSDWGAAFANANKAPIEHWEDVKGVIPDVGERAAVFREVKVFVLPAVDRSAAAEAMAAADMKEKTHSQQQQ